MLKFVTKREYWDIEESRILEMLPKKFMWHLKSIQDAVVFKHLYQCENKKIAEIGGGDSRILPVISKSNECFNIEKFEGFGNGPQGEIVVKNVTNISTMVGQFSDLIEPNCFDIIFSVSVVEHVPNEMIDDFFNDCYRILKPGGIMLHSIDLYIEDTHSRNAIAIERVSHYQKPFTYGLFKPLDPNDQILCPEDIKFSTEFATNPDNVMMVWNSLTPSLIEKRAVSQSCALSMFGTKN